MEWELISNTNEVRKLTMDIIYEITEHKAYANLTLDKELKKTNLSQADKGLVTEIVNGTIRMIKHLDWVLNLFLTKKIDKSNPWIKTILRMSLYQVMFMDKIPPYAGVNEAVKLARQKTNQNMASLVNGVLRNILRNMDNITYPPADTAEYLAVYYSHPEWLVNNLINTYGLKVSEEILAYNNGRPKLHLRVNTLQTTREILLAELTAVGVDCEASPLLPEAIIINKMNTPLEEMLAYQKGDFYIQNLASMYAAQILNPRPYDTVYDLGSGVGGKATHLVQLMNNHGEIQCYDIYANKIAILNSNANRLGIHIINTNLQNIMEITSEQVADKVLLDAPCSGLGVLNRRADLRWNKSLEDLKELNKLQKAMLLKAASLVKAEGLILYATCTINKAENEEIISEFLGKTDEFELIGFDEQLSYLPLTADEHDAAKKGTLTIIPGRYQTDGMFYALLRRKGVN